MDTWKAFDQNLTHSAVHHLVTIAELLEEFGYARVSDVARDLEITRGSASITLKRLRELGLVDNDERRFLLLTEAGRQIAESTRVKKRLMMQLFTEVLGVDAEQANVDTCKIEHLVSNATATRTAELLAFFESGRPEVKAFLDALKAFRKKEKPGADLHLVEARSEADG